VRPTPLPPPATIGVLGSGQLGRMLALAARAMGYRVHVYSPDRETPAGQVADWETSAPYEDVAAVAAFAHQVDVVTYEFENIPATTAETAARFAPLRPSIQVLHIAQNRLREKQFLAANGLPTAPFAPVESAADVDVALALVGCPAVLKTAVAGYDGKGQQVIQGVEDVREQISVVNNQFSVVSERSTPLILETFIEFEHELSVVAARGADGAFAHYGLIQNWHHKHILDVSVAPAAVPAEVTADAVAMTRTLLEALEVVGVLCVEFFLTADNRLLINEIAPRPHNSGHLTIDACLTSQFEQQLRAVCALPLGDTRYFRPAAMANLLGELWAHGEPNWSAVLAHPAVKLHLYGKRDARPGRKMGHLTALAAGPAEAAQQALAARRLLEQDASREAHSGAARPAGRKDDDSAR
jgi:5-(carboxyamino)imidazole ribonucleotide synthase